MKKEYRKPYISLERFTLSANIAQGCAGVPGGGIPGVGAPKHWSPTTCFWETYEGFTLWTEGAHCDFDGLTWDDICYNGPGTDGTYTVFSS